MERTLALGCLLSEALASAETEGPVFPVISFLKKLSQPPIHQSSPAPDNIESVVTASRLSSDKIDQCRNDSDSEVTLAADQHNPCLRTEGNSLILGFAPDHAQRQLDE